MRKSIPTWFFVLAAVRRANRFLLVHERKHGQLWYLPAGRVEPGENFVAAVQRETLEEAGISRSQTLFGNAFLDALRRIFNLSTTD